MGKHHGHHHSKFGANHAPDPSAEQQPDTNAATPEHHSKFSSPEAGKKVAEIGQRMVDIATDFIHYGEKDKEKAEVLSKFIGTSTHRHFDIKKTEWCAAMLNSVLANVGVKGTGSDGARSFLSFGTPVDQKDVQPGDIAIFQRGTEAWKGHVAIVVNKPENGKVDVIGGNQGKKQEVSIDTRSEDKLLGYRRITEKDIVTLENINKPKPNYTKLTMN